MNGRNLWVGIFSWLRIFSGRQRRGWAGKLMTAGLLSAGVATPAFAQGYRVLHDFNTLFYSAGKRPRAPLVPGPDGALYGSTSTGNGMFNGVLFRVLPDGSDYRVVCRFTEFAQGAYPSGGLALSGTILYGTTSAGGAHGKGTVFKVNTDGTGFAVLYSFLDTADNGNWSSTNSSGANPYAGVVVSGTTLYGTASEGGLGGGGTVFKLGTDGTGFTVLKHFPGDWTANPDGRNLLAPLVLSGATLYGAAAQGGSRDGGTVFKLNCDGTGFTVLANLGDTDGERPSGGLVLDRGTLYGTTSWGGAGGGTIFKLNTNGQAFAVLWSFPATADNGSGAYTNAGGAGAEAPLIVAGGTLYGSAAGGGTGGGGTLFKLNTNGTAFSTLHDFAALTNHLNPDGANVQSALLLVGGNLFGAAMLGGSSGQGTVFALGTNGAAFKVILTLPASDGANPQGTLLLSGTSLYGTTSDGGLNGRGTVFQLCTNGGGFSVLHHFEGADGEYPDGGLVQVGSRLVGAASSGGPGFEGALYQLNLDGTGFSILTSFPSTADNGAGVLTNSLGSGPKELTLAGSVLYGAAGIGGTGGGGTLFKLQTDGSGLTVLKHFTATSDSGNDVWTNADGARPNGGLVVAGNRLYGTTYAGGTNGFGTVFSLNSDGTGFTVLRHLSTNDGACPWAGLVLAGSRLYGTASGGDISAGTVFALNTDGGGFAVLKDFGGSNRDAGINPIGGLALANGLLFGTTYQYTGAGTIFKLSTNGTGFAVLKTFHFYDGGFSRGGLTVAGSGLYGTTSGGGTAQSGVVFSLSLNAPQILSASPNHGLVTVTWESFPGVTYRLQYLSTLASTNWADVPGDVTAVNLTATKADAFTTSNRFYRVVALP